MSTNTNYEGQLFNRVFNSIKTEDTIEFDPKWENGTGYLNGATKVHVEVGVIKASKDTHGRRILLIGTRYGTTVIFDRFKDQTVGGIYVMNTPSKNTLIKSLLGHSNLSYEHMENAIGGITNIGLLIEDIFEEDREVNLPEENI